MKLNHDAKDRFDADLQRKKQNTNTMKNYIKKHTNHLI
jgi:hypothetical protein